MTFLAALSLAIWIYLISFRGGFWRARPAPAVALAGAAPAVVAVVPARDEAASVGPAVRSLLAQRYPGEFQVVLIDDHSSDGTAEMARLAAAGVGAAERLHVLPAGPLEPSWTGKLSAVRHGIEHARRLLPDARYVLLTDADIAHEPDQLAALVARTEQDRLDLASLMVRLRCETLAEQALIPAFVFFFMKLYPFRWAADPERATAAAAGGCMLVRRAALDRIGGIAAIRGALIDDCALAAAIKQEGAIWIGLADRTSSLRRYDEFAEIWRMIARTAYTQLRHSPVLFAGALAGMIVTYLVPPVAALAGTGAARGLGIAAWAMMSAAYLPTLRYYRQSPLWAPALPLIAIFYAAATFDSARRFWGGRGGEWKGRFQASGRTRT